MMNFSGRALLFPYDCFTQGTSYATLMNLIRSPRPLDGEKTWQAITREIPPALDWLRLHYPPSPLRNWMVDYYLRPDHQRGIAAHYDVSNDFYELFLDKKYMFYTCADFHRDDETLEEAQTHKANFILNLIDPRPGEKILELGCGWGSMLRRIHEETGDKENLYGYTLSEEQLAYNEKHNGFQVELKNFITTDYPANHFDKIYSIGAWEHVRPAEIAGLLVKLYAALKPGGKLVQHFFCRLNNEIFATAMAGQIYFPGSMLAPYRDHVKTCEDAGFRIVHRSVHDYRPTLRAWFDNLMVNRERALDLVGVTTFNRYVTFFPASWRTFNDGLAMLVRWVMVKPS